MKKIIVIGILILFAAASHGLEQYRLGRDANKVISQGALPQSDYIDRIHLPAHKWKRTLALASAGFVVLSPASGQGFYMTIGSDARIVASGPVGGIASDITMGNSPEYIQPRMYTTRLLNRSSQAYIGFMAPASMAVTLMYYK